MRYLILFLLFLSGSMNMDAQTVVITGYGCDYTVVPDCRGCDLTPTFNGIVVKRSGVVDQGLHYPLKITKVSNLIHIQDPFGEKAVFSINQTRFTVRSLYAYLETFNCGGGGGGGSWGGITGNIDNQSDLRGELDAKADTLTTDALDAQQTTNTANIATNTSDIGNKANTADVLTKTNVTSYTPSADYHPATKKYVEDYTEAEKPYIDVTDYGVTGLGLVAEQDSIAAAWAAYVADTTKGYIYFPEGEYLVTARTLMGDRTDIKIVGDNATFLIDNAINSATKAVGCVFYIGRLTDFTVRSVHIEGLDFNFQSNASNDAVALFMGNPRGIVKIVDCKFYNFGNNDHEAIHLNSVGEDVDEGGYGYFPGIEITGCNFFNTFTLTETSYNYAAPFAKGVGVRFEDVSEFSKIHACTFWGIGVAAQYYEGANAVFENNVVNFCDPGANNKGAVWLQNGATTNNGKLTIADCQFKHNKRYVIYCDYATTQERGMFIHDNQFIANNWTVIYIDNMARNMIQGNYFNRANLHTLAISSPFSGNGDAIRLIDSDWNNIQLNTFYDGINNTLYGTDSDNNVFKNNIEDTVTATANFDGTSVSNTIADNH